ncbi:hypothetical protein ACE0DR_18655 [Azotobacter sp. CWF10]
MDLPSLVQQEGMGPVLGRLRRAGPAGLAQGEHRREAAALGTEVGGLPLVDARGQPLDPPVVDVGAQVVFHRAARRGTPLARCHQRLGDIAAAQDVLPDTPGELVAAVGATAAEAADRLEEQPAPLGPQALGTLGPHQPRARHVAQQDRLRLLRDAQTRQHLGIAQIGQAPLVGVEGMRLRMRRQHHGIAQIGFAQGPAVIALQIEIGQAVVHQVDGLLAQQQPAVAQLELRRVGDQGLDAVPAEQVPEQQEFRIQVLALRRLVDDRHTTQRRLPARHAPFAPEHLQHGPPRSPPRLRGSAAAVRRPRSRRAAPAPAPR